ncbi:thiamine-phosphate diphosphorylase [Sinobaca qinghaiensis]|uniref:Thiamine-phosphate synthase n=1 Tax=Sinobaca qinghaiensis TaxID=342944 RepID=A0A419V4A1_9BACL|nr:thiamine phosphate synthase [Sinobaca qinghaiensis]RKD73272.1 thiamine-phosphate diphosphorylase [Sinobaca qinghaiensis]
MNKETLLLYFIMGSQDTDKDPAEVLKQAVAGGITCFQFREKGPASKTVEQKEELARELLAVCRSHSIPFIVNDDVDLAVQIGADGVHIGQGDEPASSVKKKLPAHMIVGVSAKTLKEAEKAVQDEADYIGTGPMYATTSKDDADEPIGPEGIQDLRKFGITLPIVGIGGITEKNVKSIMRAGADGVSLISAISRAIDPKEAAQRLRQLAQK